jgi:5,6-dimethylbenzimidazole synthase
MKGADTNPTDHAPFLQPEAIGEFSEQDKRAVYEAMALRRDVRHFRSDREIHPDVLTRILTAAHHAPSVGLSQPWGFVVVRDREVRTRIRENFLRCRELEAARYEPARRAAYLAHRLEGILEAPLNLCVAVDLRERALPVLGTTMQPDTLRASAYCAVQNLWLAARVEGVGVGWVSILATDIVREELALPAGVEPVAYLCVGYPVAFRHAPMLEETGWGQRSTLQSALHLDGVWSDAGRVDIRR